MAKPFKFRYVNEISGAFAGVIALLLLTGLLLAGRAQRWFQPVTRVTILLPEEGAFGLKHGDEVRMLGVGAGQVDQISAPDEQTGRMTMVVDIDPRLARFIRMGVGSATGAVRDSASKAIIRVPIGIGDPFVEISRGSGAALAGNEVLNAELETSTADSISQTMAEVRTQTIPEVEALLKQYTRLAADLQNEQGPFEKTLVHFDHIAENLERTDTVMGRITSDKQFAAKLDQAMDGLASSTDQVHAVLTHLDETTAKLPEVIASLKKSADTLPDVMIHTQQTLIELQRLVRGLEALPIINSSIDQTSQSKTLPPSAVEMRP